MGYSKKIEWETMQTINAATFTGSYVALGTPLAFPSYKIKIFNDSNVLILISNDGTNDKDVCPVDGFFLYDSDLTVDHIAVPAGTQFYIKASAGAGLVYLVSQYIIQP